MAIFPFFFLCLRRGDQRKNRRRENTKITHDGRRRQRRRQKGIMKGVKKREELPLAPFLPAARGHKRLGICASCIYAPLRQNCPWVGLKKSEESVRIRKKAGNVFVSTNFPSDIALGLSYQHSHVSPGDCGNRVAFKHQRDHEGDLVSYLS